jgi:RHS repeat-associated protein
MKNVNADPQGTITGTGYGAGTWEFYFYGLNGRKMGTIDCGYATGHLQSCQLTGQNAYFAGKLIVENGGTVATDRLGSVRANGYADSGNIKYFPYGAEQTATTEGVTKFATYTRDAVGQDYAEQRYYNAGMGRFWSPDPGGIKAADRRNPASWNLYAYVHGDPINLNDPRGMDPNCGPEMSWDGEGCTQGTTLNGAAGTGGTADCWSLFGMEGCESDTGDDPCGGQVNGFLDPMDPNPCPAGGGPSTTQAPSCTVELGYVANVLGSPFSHSYIEVTTPATGTEYIEASPTFSLRYVLPIMKVNVTPTGIYNDSTIGTIVWSESGPEDCIDAVGLLAKAASFPLSYYPGLTSNSNSFASALLADVGILVGGPPKAIGWGDPVIPVLSWF